MEHTDETRPKRSWGRFFAVLLAGALVAVCIIVVTETRSDAVDATYPCSSPGDQEPPPVPRCVG
jgi:hypothetical protein